MTVTSARNRCRIGREREIKVEVNAAPSHGVVWGFSCVCVCVRVKGFEQIQEDMHCYAWKFLVNWKLDRYGYGGNFHFIIPCLFPTFFYETFFFPTVETENHSFFKLHVLSLIWIFYLLLLLLLFFVIYYYSFVYLYLFLINVDKKNLLFALSFTKQGVAIIIEVHYDHGKYSDWIPGENSSWEDKPNYAWKILVSFLGNRKVWFDNTL